MSLLTDLMEAMKTKMAIFSLRLHMPSFVIYALSFLVVEFIEKIEHQLIYENTDSSSISLDFRVKHFSFLLISIDREKLMLIVCHLSS